MKGPLNGPIKAIVFLYFLDFSGPYEPGPGPHEGETLQEKRTFPFYCNAFLSKIVDLHTNTKSSDSFNVFFRFLAAEIRFRTIMKLPQRASFGTKTCSFRTSVTLP